MNYTQAIDYLFNSLPMFSRIGASAYKEGLDNTLALDEYFSHPHKKFKTIHVAGTNGKGSVSHLLAACLQKAGYKTGLYTSPHLKDFRERIRIDGEMITEQFVVDFTNENRPFFDKINPSFFEMTVLMAFDYFAKNKVDIAVIEVGLGGRLDSTNIISPELSIITNISFDHMNLLGNTLEKIAIEKAGIIKPQTPVVIGEAKDEVKAVFEKKATAEKCDIFFAQEYTSVMPAATKIAGKQVFDCDGFENLSVGLLGIYQQKNVATVLTAIKILNQKGFNISEKSIREGFDNVVESTGLLGRWQILQTNPLIICDTGHNEAGISYVVKQLASIPYNQLHMIIGVVNDKDIEKILSLLPQNAIYYFTRAAIPRALDEKELQEKASTHHLLGKCFHTVKESINAAKLAANEDDVIFIGGSNFIVADALC
jgi:dihydrofolate synthase/folylpolyglutamate synthase